MNQKLLAFLLAFFTTVLATPLAIKVSPMLGIMDVPKDARRVHNKPISRFGGIALLCGIFSVFLIIKPLDKQITGLMIGALIIYVEGLIDDIVDLNAKIKLAGQILSAIVLCLFNVRVIGINNYFGEGAFVFPMWLSMIITVCWVVGITNTINLMDGLDGLAAGLVCIASMAISYTAGVNGQETTVKLCLAIVGATLGFLIYNFYPAKIFMGDAGAQLLGFFIASIPLIGVSPVKGTTLFATLVPIMVLALPIFDTAFAIIRRVADHRPIMQADKGHLHHRIMMLGFGQRRTVLALYSISAIMAIAGIVWTNGLRWEALILGLIAAVLVVIFLGIGVVDKKTGEGDEKCEK